MNAQPTNLARLFCEANSNESISFLSSSGLSHFGRAELFACACVQAQRFQKQGAVPGDTVAVIGPTSPGLIVSILAAWILGCHTAVIPHPLRGTSLTAWWEQRWRVILGALNNPIVAPAVDYIEPMRRIGVTRVVEELATLTPVTDSERWYDAIPDRTILHRQFTSGTTGVPRLMEVSHDQIAHNAKMVGQRLSVRGDDSLCSWLPLHHDMGFVGAFGFTAVWQIPLHLMQSEKFQRHPASWLRYLADTKTTITPAPPSAYALLARYASPARLSKLELGRWRTALVGAEPLRAADLQSFADLSHKFELNVNLVPCYGMAEATLAVSMAFPDQEFTLSTGAPAGSAIAASGSLLEGISMKVASSPGYEVPGMGDIFVRGDTVNAETGEWLDTGDQGFIEKGQVFVLGRRKDTLIVGGKNYDPAWVEQVATDALVGVHSMKKPRCAAVQLRDGRIGVLVACSDWQPVASDTIRKAVTAEFGIRVALDEQVSRGQLPLTTSGKLSRIQCKNCFSD